jgi:hypothetical protein
MLAGRLAPATAMRCRGGGLSRPGRVSREETADPDCNTGLGAVDVGLEGLVLQFSGIDVRTRSHESRSPGC